MYYLSCPATNTYFLHFGTGEFKSGFSALHRSSAPPTHSPTILYLQVLFVVCLGLSGPSYISHNGLSIGTAAAYYQAQQLPAPFNLFGCFIGLACSRSHSRCGFTLYQKAWACPVAAKKAGAMWFHSHRRRYKLAATMAYLRGFVPDVSLLLTCAPSLCLLRTSFTSTDSYWALS